MKRGPGDRIQGSNIVMGSVTGSTLIAGGGPRGPSGSGAARPAANWTPGSAGARLRVFASHSSADKALVREVIGQLPPEIAVWLDEEALVCGDPLREVITRTLRWDVDLVVAFVSHSAARSTWFQEEVAIALEEEARRGAPFILPVLLEPEGAPSLPPSLAGRLYLRCPDQSRASVTRLSQELGRHLAARAAHR